LSFALCDIRARFADRPSWEGSQAATELTGATELVRNQATVAVLDVGAFSAHLVVVDGALSKQLLSHKVRLHLDQATDGAGRISAGGIDRIAHAVQVIQRRMRKTPIGTFLPYATSSVRDAANADQVIATVTQRTGLTLRLLSGRREARLAYLAPRRWLQPAGPLTVLDVGGGTVEIAHGDNERPDFACSLPIGARTLTRAGLTDGRHLRTMRAQVAEHIADALPTTLREELARAPGVGCSKVFQQLAKLTQTRQLRAADVATWISRLADMTARRRAELPGIPRHRARQALAGAVVAEALMTTTGQPVIDICPWSTKEGVLLTLLDQRH
jgi:exopolyphosphatase/guanosine-5'-triphosphate,3'-diphosphate pyrophosphatase